jgi:hypothetical protein
MKTLFILLFGLLSLISYMAFIYAVFTGEYHLSIGVLFEACVFTILFLFLADERKQDRAI